MSQIVTKGAHTPPPPPPNKKKILKLNPRSMYQFMSVIMHLCRPVLTRTHTQTRPHACTATATQDNNCIKVMFCPYFFKAWFHTRRQAPLAHSFITNLLLQLLYIKALSSFTWKPTYESQRFALECRYIHKQESIHTNSKLFPLGVAVAAVTAEALARVALVTDRTDPLPRVGVLRDVRAGDSQSDATLWRCRDKTQ